MTRWNLDGVRVAGEVLLLVALLALGVAVATTLVYGVIRTDVPPDRGMIFPYEPAQEVAFWMKNTLVPLDIIYIRPDGKIGRITKAEAMDLTPLPSGEPISAVLEIRSGRAAELGIKEGDTVRWSR